MAENLLSRLKEHFRPKTEHYLDATPDTVRADTARYGEFKDLPQDVAERLKARARELKGGYDRRLARSTSSPAEYSEQGLGQLIAMWLEVNHAIGHGLPNQVHEILIKTLDPEIVYKAHFERSVWLGHEGDEIAESNLYDFVDQVLYALAARRINYSLEDFNNEFSSI